MDKFDCEKGRLLIGVAVAILSFGSYMSPPVPPEVEIVVVDDETLLLFKSFDSVTLSHPSAHTIQ